MIRKNLARVMGLLLPAVLLMTGCSVELQDERLDKNIIFDIDTSKLEDSIDAIAEGEMPELPSVDLKTDRAIKNKAGTGETEPDYKEYKSDMGWKAEYDASVINLEDTDPSGEVDFIYTGECAGTCMLAVTYSKDRLPDKEIEDLKTVQGSNKVDISGGFFPGTTDKWAYWVTPVYAEEGSGYHEDYILGEYNGGTLCFQFITHRAGDEEMDTAVSDALAMIVDSLTFDDFGPQTMYDGIPGTYTQSVEEEIEGKKIKAEYALKLSDDHTGTLSLQDEIDILWDDRMIMAADGSFRYYTTIKDDTITVDYDGEKLKFTK